jgi:hypothetical protein
LAVAAGSVVELKPARPREYVEQIGTQARVGHVGVVHQQIGVLPGVHALLRGVRALVATTDLVDPMRERLALVGTELGLAVVVRPLVVGVVVQTSVGVALVCRVGVATKLEGAVLVGEADLHGGVHLVHHRDTAAVSGVVLTGGLDHEDAVVRLHLVGHHLPGTTEVEPDDAEQVGVAVRALLDHRRRAGNRRGLLGGSGLGGDRRRRSRLGRRQRCRGGCRDRRGVDRCQWRSCDHTWRLGVASAECECRDSTQQSSDDEDCPEQWLLQHLRTCSLAMGTAMTPWFRDAQPKVMHIVT